MTNQTLICQSGRAARHADACRGTGRLYHHTPETDALICDAYAKLRNFGNRRALPVLCAKLGWPKQTINRRGRELGLARIKEKPWSPEEKQALEKWADLSLSRIHLKLKQAGFQRSETGIKLKLRRLLIAKDVLPYHSATKIAIAMGIDGHKVASWIHRGWLRSEKKGTARTERQGGDVHLVHTNDLRRFLLHHPEEYELAPVEKFWLLDVVSGGRLCEEYRNEVA